MNKARMAARAANNPTLSNGRNSGPVSTDLAARVITEPHRRVSTRLSRGKRPGSDKGQGLWRTTSPNYRTMVTVDSRWSA